MIYIIYSLSFVALYLLLSNYWRGRLLADARTTIRYQEVWIKAQQKMLENTRRERNHAVKSMTAFFPTPTGATIDVHPEGWDA